MRALISKSKPEVWFHEGYSSRTWVWSASCVLDELLDVLVQAFLMLLIVKILGQSFSSASFIAAATCEFNHDDTRRLICASIAAFR